MTATVAFETPTPFTRDYAPLAVVWTRDDCAALEKAGVLNYRYELIEGVILRKMGQYRQHNLPVTRAMFWLGSHFDRDCLQTQSSIFVAWGDNKHNMSEPDLLLLSRPLQDLGTDQPRPEDVRFVLGVSHTTLSYDCGSKAGLYARAGITEYWVLSVEERRLYVHTNPQNGAYTRAAFTENETVALGFAPDVAIRACDLLMPLDKSVSPILLEDAA